MSLQPVNFTKYSQQEIFSLPLLLPECLLVDIRETHYIGSTNNFSDILNLFNIFMRVLDRLCNLVSAHINLINCEPFSHPGFTFKVK